MLFKRPALEAIAAGEVSLAFRRWKRPSVRSGGELRTPVGVLRIDRVERATLKSITPRDATRAGYASRDDLIEELRRHEGALYRIEFELGGEDPRIELRRRARLSANEVRAIASRLDRFDETSTAGPWTRATLELLANEPATPAGAMAKRLGFEKAWLKRQVRKLKELGLTESLGVGYRLSPRGAAFRRSGA
ncbi:MAG: hypothetical protein ACF8PN_06600 [Phycisphaerales bacterium]